MPALEIERKFLIDQIPDELDIVDVIDIQQGYIYSNKEIELRIRKKNDRFFQTIKQGSGLSRNELEIEISYKQFSQLWPLTEGKRLEKKRFEIYQKKT